MTETIRLTHHVGGRAVDGAMTFSQASPSNPDDLVVEGPEADAALVAEAVANARSAVDALDQVGIEARADALSRIGRTLLANADRLALLATRETGKTINDAKGEVVRAARTFDFFAGEALRNIGERFASTRPGAMVEVDYAPVGVVAAITPWNFPFAIPAWKIAPAIAFGNAVVWKPSEIASASAEAFRAILAEAGLPVGTVEMLLGAGGAGAALTGADGVDAISFTGSVATGNRVVRAAAEKGVRAQMEMGGVNGLIILDDANLDVAVDCAINGAYFNAGQRCTATSRIIITDGIADRFIAAFIERAKALKIGDPRDPQTQIGSLAAFKQKTLIASQVEQAEAAGFKPLIGGSADARPHAFFAPTLFDNAAPASLLGQEEIFGPVAGLFRVRDFEEAMTVLNNNRYGLSSSICTRSLVHAEQFKRRARTGMRMVNMPTAGADYHAPFGGVGISSFGPREQGRAARTFYTTLHTTYQLAV